MKNDRRLSSVARKENPHCPCEDGGGGGKRRKERKDEDEVEGKEEEEEAAEKEQASTSSVGERSAGTEDFGSGIVEKHVDG